MVSIFTLTSPLHDKSAVDAVTREFLDGLGVEYSFKGDDYDDYGSELSLIYVRTGGTEGLFKELLPTLQGLSRQAILLLTSGKSNSLAASMEILSYLRQEGLRGEILHGSPAYIRSRIEALSKVEEARRFLEYTTLGIVGHPSDWLISSGFDRGAIFDRLGINLQYIPMEELLEEYSLLKDEVAESWKEVVGCHSERSEESTPLSTAVKQAIPGAYRIYKALKTLVSDYGLSGLTIRCFDLLTAVHNTGCLALARLNSEGYVAGCEGDVPAMISMMIGRAVTGVSGFQANPSSINPETGEIVFSHCTVPLDMVSGYGLDTHFESGIGVGIRGNIPEGPVTVFKVSGDLSRHFVCEGELLRCEAKPDLCRTQAVLRLPPAASEYFLTEPIGNHHIILPGHVAAELEALLSF
jgi:L-fucose isomerase-like protein